MGRDTSDSAGQSPQGTRGGPQGARGGPAHPHPCWASGRVFLSLPHSGEPLTHVRGPRVQMSILHWSGQPPAGTRIIPCAVPLVPVIPCAVPLVPLVPCVVPLVPYVVPLVPCVVPLVPLSKWTGLAKGYSLSPYGFETAGPAAPEGSGGSRRRPSKRRGPTTVQYRARARERARARAPARQGDDGPGPPSAGKSRSGVGSLG